MRQLVKRLFLYETSPYLRTSCIEVAEWDPEARRFYVGDLCLPESAAKEWIVVQSKPVDSTPAPAPTVRKGPPKR